MEYQNYTARTLTKAMTVTTFN